jgi:hypothetical protein
VARHRIGEEARRFDAAPELAFGSDNQVLVERISMGGDFNPFTATGDHKEDRPSGRNHGCRLLSYTLKWLVFKMKVKTVWESANYKLRIEFIDENGSGPGVRKRPQKKS